MSITYAQINSSSIPVDTIVRRADGKVVGVQFTFHSDADRMRLISFLAGRK